MVVRKYLLSREGAPIIVEHKGNETITDGWFGRTTPTSASKPERELSFQGNSSIWPNSQNQPVMVMVWPISLIVLCKQTTRTAHYILRNNPNYSEFLKLCEGLTTNVLDKAGLYDSLKAKKLDDAAGKEREKIALKYYIFVAGNKAGQVV